jgi:hypothetical protein
MDLLMVVLRLIHFVGGVFWAGTMFFIVVFLLPTVAAVGPAGGQFMQRLAVHTRFSMGMGIAAGLTILSGFGMYARVSSGFQGAWMASGTGVTLAIGALAAIAGAISGGMTGSTGQRLGNLMSSVQAKGGPTAAQTAEAQALQQRMSRLSHLTAVLLLIAVIMMAIARYV